jgi:hypothetical protein
VGKDRIKKINETKIRVQRAGGGRSAFLAEQGEKYVIAKDDFYFNYSLLGFNSLYFINNPPVAATNPRQRLQTLSADGY